MIIAVVVNDWHEQTQTEVSAIAYRTWALAWFLKVDHQRVRSVSYGTFAIALGSELFCWYFFIFVRIYH